MYLFGNATGNHVISNLSRALLASEMHSARQYRFLQSPDLQDVTALSSKGFATVLSDLALRATSSVTADDFVAQLWPLSPITTELLNGTIIDYLNTRVSQTSANAPDMFVEAFSQSVTQTSSIPTPNSYEFSSTEIWPVFPDSQVNYLYWANSRSNVVPELLFKLPSRISQINKTLEDFDLHEAATDCVAESLLTCLQAPPKERLISTNLKLAAEYEQDLTKAVDRYLLVHGIRLANVEKTTRLAISDPNSLLYKNRTDTKFSAAPSYQASLDIARASCPTDKIAIFDRSIVEFVPYVAHKNLIGGSIITPNATADGASWPIECLNASAVLDKPTPSFTELLPNRLTLELQQQCVASKCLLDTPETDYVECLGSCLSSTDANILDIQFNAHACRQHLRVAPALPNRTGSAWHTDRQKLHDGFRTHFTFVLKQPPNHHCRTAHDVPASIRSTKSLMDLETSKVAPNNGESPDVTFDDADGTLLENPNIRFGDTDLGCRREGGNGFAFVIHRDHRSEYFDFNCSDPCVILLNSQCADIVVNQSETVREVATRVSPTDLGVLDSRNIRLTGNLAKGNPAINLLFDPDQTLEACAAVDQTNSSGLNETALTPGRQHWYKITLQSSFALTASSCNNETTLDVVLALVDLTGQHVLGFSTPITGDCSGGSVVAVACKSIPAGSYYLVVSAVGQSAGSFEVSLSFHFDVPVLQKFPFRIFETPEQCVLTLVPDSCPFSSCTYTQAIGGGSLGYNGIENSLAIEFDTVYDSDNEELFHNTIAVHARYKADNGDQVDSLIGTAQIAHAIRDGQSHTVMIEYLPEFSVLTDPDHIWAQDCVDPEASPTDSAYRSCDWMTNHMRTFIRNQDPPTSHTLGQQSLNPSGSPFRVGLLRVYVDDMIEPILNVPTILEEVLGISNERGERCSCVNGNQPEDQLSQVPNPQQCADFNECAWKFEWPGFNYVFGEFNHFTDIHTRSALSHTFAVPTAWVGFTSATATSFQDHDIVQWRLCEFDSTEELLSSDRCVPLVRVCDETGCSQQRNSTLAAHTHGDKQNVGWCPPGRWQGRCQEGEKCFFTGNFACRD
eukprot:c577_g1_i1.p1 GENE.c577_g1_i1~~c577_g1_i1.p1  ORF type:complete len:1076 (+),score=196.54 c577_g1_i1:1551-4778(+)